jgi:hypothetical protein
VNDMDALDILARFDADQPVTETELGYLLPKLKRLGHAEDAYTAQHCCDRAVARLYRFRGNQVLWFTGSSATPKEASLKSRKGEDHTCPDGRLPRHHNLSELRPRLAFLPRCFRNNHRGFWPPAHLRKNRLIRRPLM